MTVEIEITATRNPNYVTYSIDHDLIPPGTGLTYPNAESAESDPLAKALFAIPGVEAVWVLGNSIHVTKDEKIRWPRIQSRVIDAIRRNTNSN
ncbi:MAG: hypothetical protein NPINA01_22540 [Nitrospinaceae bacterium]|nr:MAG: hypothetical protein NPINA01_22540 [Nitrospinaceae bacterium]